VSGLALALLPLVVIQIGLLVWTLVDLPEPERRVRRDSKLVWVLVAVLVNLIGFIPNERRAPWTQ
jgi:hypothetical protein